MESSLKHWIVGSLWYCPWNNIVSSNKKRSRDKSWKWYLNNDWYKEEEKIFTNPK
jgi:hypothetical protein